MAEAKTDWQPTGLERFGHLEDKLFRLVEAFKTIRKENDGLKAENLRIKAEMEAIQKNDASAQQALSQMQKEREELRERVEKALSMLAILDAR